MLTCTLHMHTHTHVCMPTNMHMHVPPGLRHPTQVCEWSTVNYRSQNWSKAKQRKWQYYDNHIQLLELDVYASFELINKSWITSLQFVFDMHRNISWPLGHFDYIVHELTLVSPDPFPFLSDNCFSISMQKKGFWRFRSTLWDYLKYKPVTQPHSRLSPHVWTNCQAMEGWAGPGNKATGHM